MSAKENVRAKETWADREFARRNELLDAYKSCPIPDDEILGNLAMFIPKTEFSRILYTHELYKKIMDVHGSIMEFGVR